MTHPSAPPPRLRLTEAQDPAFKRLRLRTFGLWLAAAALTAAAVSFDAAAPVAVLSVGGLILLTMLDLHHQRQIENFLHYRQIAALLNIRDMIEPRAPLPPMRLWAASPDFALLVATTISQHRPQQVLELGSGTSTLIAAYILESLDHGAIISLDHDARFAEKTRQLLRQHHLADRAQVVNAPLTPLDNLNDQPWYTTDALAALPPIDLLIVDGPPDMITSQARYPALPLLFDYLADGALILVDDYMRRDEHAMVLRWLDTFPVEVVDTFPIEKGAALLRKCGASRPDR